MTIRTYMDLEAWKEGIELAVQVYQLTDRFPRYERFGLSSQMCRAAVSIPSNVAEGQCKSRKEFQHHVSHSRGSLQELMTLVVIADRRSYGSADLLAEIRVRADREGRLLSGLRRSLMG
ncbi:MAG TPA: four helix bundle protein [Gemmatimonadaceae bacterium]